MAGVRVLAERVRKLEAARISPRSPFESAYGSFDAFAEQAHEAIDAGTYDSKDMPTVLTCLRRWHREGAWGLWRRDRIWEHSG